MHELMDCDIFIYAKLSLQKRHLNSQLLELELTSPYFFKYKIKNKYKFF